MFLGLLVYIAAWLKMYNSDRKENINTKLTYIRQKEEEFKLAKTKDSSKSK
jgi:hypothetical protein